MQRYKTYKTKDKNRWINRPSVTIGKKNVRDSNDVEKLVSDIAK